MLSQVVNSATQDFTGTFLSVDNNSQENLKDLRVEIKKATIWYESLNSISFFFL